TQQLHQALNAVWAVIADANRYFAGEAPWALAKTDPARQSTVLHTTAEVIRQVAILAQPVMPQSAGRMLDLLAVPAGERDRAGLDYHYDFGPREAQEEGFRRHIAAARETGLPLVIHSREADDDMARILTEETGKGAFPAILHCFTAGPDLARTAIALGLHISF